MVGSVYNLLHKAQCSAILACMHTPEKRCTFWHYKDVWHSYFWHSYHIGSAADCDYFWVSSKYTFIVCTCITMATILTALLLFTYVSMCHFSSATPSCCLRYRSLWVSPVIFTPLYYVYIIFCIFLCNISCHVRNLNVGVHSFWVWVYTG